MKTLQQGDYVTDLTEEQFDELLVIGHSVALTWKSNSRKARGFKIKSVMLGVKCRLNHTKTSEATTELPFEEFKKRAINTFQIEPLRENFKIWLESDNVIKTPEGYRCQCMQYTKAFTISGIYRYFIKEYQREYLSKTLI